MSRTNPLSFRLTAPVIVMSNANLLNPVAHVFQLDGERIDRARLKFALSVVFTAQHVLTRGCLAAVDLDVHVGIRACAGHLRREHFDFVRHV